jgi:hypothetical protein
MSKEVEAAGLLFVTDFPLTRALFSWYTKAHAKHL